MDLEKPRVSLKQPATKLEASLGGLSLVLRPYVVADAPELARAVVESLPELRKFMFWAHFEQTVAGQMERLQGVVADYWNGRDQLFGAYDRTSGEFMAAIGLHHRTLNSRAMEIGYWTRTKYAGRGVATMGTKMLVVYCFEYLGFDRVQCGYNEANVGSRRVNDKCGFKVEGRLRNFETRPTPEMVASGYKCGAVNVIGGIVSEDVPQLTWYADVKKALRVYDWQGRLVPAPVPEGGDEAP